MVLFQNICLISILAEFYLGTRDRFPQFTYNIFLGLEDCKVLKPYLLAQEMGSPRIRGHLASGWRNKIFVLVGGHFRQAAERIFAQFGPELCNFSWGTLWFLLLKLGFQYI